MDNSLLDLWDELDADQAEPTPPVQEIELDRFRRIFAKGIF